MNWTFLKTLPSQRILDHHLNVVSFSLSRIGAFPRKVPRRIFRRASWRSRPRPTIFVSVENIRRRSYPAEVYIYKRAPCGIFREKRVTWRIFRGTRECYFYGVRRGRNAREEKRVLLCLVWINFRNRFWEMRYRCLRGCADHSMWRGKYPFEMKKNIPGNSAYAAFSLLL